MRKLLISAVIAVSLMTGLAGSALALPDDHACGHANSNALSVFANLGGCVDHSP